MNYKYADRSKASKPPFFISEKFALEIYEAVFEKGKECNLENLKAVTLAGIIRVELNNFWKLGGATITERLDKLADHALEKNTIQELKNYELGVHCVSRIEGAFWVNIKLLLDFVIQENQKDCREETLEKIMEYLKRVDYICQNLVNWLEIEEHSLVTILPLFHTEADVVEFCEKHIAPVRTYL